MAPIYAAAVGVTPQIIDDDRLAQLRDSLQTIEFLQVPTAGTGDTGGMKSNISPAQVQPPLDIARLVALLEPWQTWVFEEQVRKQCFVFVFVWS
jgi:hypothetical protein